MTDTDTSAEAVERLARAMEARIIETYGGHGTVLEMPDDDCNATAATLCALLAERDEARREVARLREAATAFDAAMESLWDSGPVEAGHINYISGVDEAWARLRAALAKEPGHE